MVSCELWWCAVYPGSNIIINDNTGDRYKVPTFFFNLRYQNSTSKIFKSSNTIVTVKSKYTRAVQI